MKEKGLTPKETAELEKIELEKKKILLEIENLKQEPKGKWKKVQLSAPIITSVASLLIILYVQISLQKSGFFSTKEEKLIVETERLQLRKDSLSKQYDKLLDQFNFIALDKDLKNIRLSDNPKAIQSLIDTIKLSKVHRTRIIDSIIELGKINDYHGLSLLILFKGTGDLIYKQSLLAELPLYLKQCTIDSGVSEYRNFNILTDSIWSANEKKDIIKLTLTSLPYVKDLSKKQKILCIAYVYKLYNDSFNLYQVDYQLYWDYLKVNRDLIFSNQPNIDRMSALINITSYSPELSWAILFKISCQTCDFGNKEMNLEMDNLLLTFIAKKDDLPPSTYSYFMDFYKHVKYEYEPVSQYYLKNKNRLDVWLNGDFEKFRTDQSEFEKVINNKSY